MSLARFSPGCDVYVFECDTDLGEGVKPALTCCGCSIGKGDFFADTPQGMIDHLRKHQERSDSVPEYVFEELDGYEFLP